MPATMSESKPSKAMKAVRLELLERDYERLEHEAEKLGLTKASYARMVILEKLRSEGSAK